MSRVRVKLRVNITLRHTFSCVWLSQKPRCIVLCCSCDQLGEVCFAAAVISINPDMWSDIRSDMWVRYE